MILTPDQLIQARQGRFSYATTIGKQWPDKTVYYSYALDVQARPRAQQVIQQAIAEYHQKTCIRFKKRTNEPHFIQFYIGPGCSSYVGFNGGGKWPMPVSLAQGCWKKGIVIHELGHALGVHHEQNRPDRDKHVKINWDNIEPGTTLPTNTPTVSPVTKLPSTTKKLLTKGPGKDCKDSHPGCPGWQSICKTHQHIASLCKRTCKLC